MYRLTDWWDLGITMKANAALCLMALGFALLLLTLRPTSSALIRSLGLFAAAVGMVTLFQHVTGLNVGIDTLLFHEPHGTGGTSSPGRMGPLTAAIVITIGTAVILLTGTGRGRGVGVALALFALSMVTLILAGYVYAIEAMYAHPHIAGVAIQTMTIMAVLSIGLVVVGAPHVLDLLLEESTAGMLARRAIPAAILVPLSIGLLRNAGEQAGLYGFAFGAALRAVVEIVVMIGLIWWAVQVIRNRDIQQQRAEQRQATLVSELQHRVRNTLALVRSVATKTIASSDNVADLSARLLGRIDALSRTQALLTRAPGSGIDLQQLLQLELFSQSEEQQLRIEGPTIAVSPKTAEVLLLAMHELATNATKYGALSHPHGQIHVVWLTFDVNGQQWLRLLWQETCNSGVTNVPKPTRTGFGTELITRRVPYELLGRTSICYPPSGLHCTIEFPLRDGDSILQTDHSYT